MATLLKRLLIVAPAAALALVACAAERTRAAAPWPVVAPPAEAPAAMVAGYRVLAGRADRLRDMLARIDDATARCARSPSSEACVAAADDASKAVAELRALLTEMRYVCRSEDPERRPIEKLSNELVDVAAVRLDEASTALEAVAGEVFERAREHAELANPVRPPRYHCHDYW